LFNVHYVHRLIICLLAMALLVENVRAQNCWRELHFGVSNGWLGATTSLRYDTLPAAEARSALRSPPQGKPLPATGNSVRRIHVDLSALNSSGGMDIWYNVESSQVLQVERIGHGRESRMKLHRFMSGGVWRERLTPTSDPQQWASGKRELLPYPANRPAKAPVLVPIMLLERAAHQARTSAARAPGYLVFTDRQLYDVTLQSRGVHSLAVDYQLKEGGRKRRIEQTVKVMQIELQPKLLGDQPEDDPFTLFELGGNLTIYVDLDRFLPVRIQGSRFGFGSIPANLTSATLAGKCD
jgi:hypothetical protein